MTSSYPILYNYITVKKKGLISPTFVPHRQLTWNLIMWCFVNCCPSLHVNSRDLPCVAWPPGEGSKLRICSSSWQAVFVQKILSHLVLKQYKNISCSWRKKVHWGGGGWETTKCGTKCWTRTTSVGEIYCPTFQLQLEIVKPDGRQLRVESIPTCGNVGQKHFYNVTILQKQCFTRHFKCEQIQYFCLRIQHSDVQVQLKM